MDNSARVSELFLRPWSESFEKSIAIARDLQSDSESARVDQAFQDSFDHMLNSSGMTADQLEAQLTPRTWFGRMAERLQDWWWDWRSKSDSAVGEEDALAAALSFPIPLFQTHPLQDVPFEYDDIYATLARTTGDLSAAISAQTDWQRIPFERPIQGEDDWDEDPMQLVLALWQHPKEESVLVLVDQDMEDPKLMGHTLGLVKLSDDQAAHLRRRI